jgi:F-type H+-transporting ATPase subunit alpha
MINPSEISDILKQQLVEDIAKRQVAFEEEGTVLEVGDGVAHAYGLHNVEANELVQFENGVTGVAMNLEESDVGIILLDEVDTVTENMKVRRTGAIASIEVGEGLLGRVINVLAKPIDGKGPIEGDKLRLPLERKAPGVIFRQPVNQPLQTGLKAIDSMIPIGRGQRELIIGDRQIGKTAIAVDTIINQRAGYEAGKPVYCIYVAIGQKASTVAALVNKLEESGALPYTIVVAATAADSASMRYYAPFAGAAIGEYFRDTGRDALVIYDDLSKHAVAYREISLILKRPSGREAYPGDIFYLHSRLLERAAKINENQAVASVMNDLPAPLKPIVKGGGSLTALPIIETQAGDVSAYIPTNVISITDGQIYLESALFNSGIRPAVNVGISVSRVGGNAQIKCMKKVAGTLKIAQAQYRELEAFTKFGGDIDPVTARTIDTGRKNERLLVQAQYTPMKVEEQVAIIYCGVNGLLRDVPLDKVAEFEKLFINYLRGKHQSDVLDVLRTGKIDDDVMSKLKHAAAEVAAKYTEAPAS